MATSKRRPSERGQGAEEAAIGPASSVADIATSFRSGRAPLQPRQQREREVALQVPLVELVEDDHADAAERGLREQPPA